MKSKPLLIAAVFLIFMLHAEPTKATESAPDIREKTLILDPNTSNSLLHTEIGKIKYISENVADCAAVFYNLGAESRRGSSILLHTDTNRLIIKDSAQQIDLIMELLSKNFKKQ